MYLLADCNNFFASCEMVFNPKLEKKALVILSNNDGCIVARSPIAKKLGIKMGDPAYQYRDWKELVMLSANFALYSDMSQRVMQTLSTFTPDLEIYSIDEAFLHLEDRPDLKELCFEIQKKVKKWTGIPISIGAAPTKTLAKLASELGKKEGGIFILRKEEIETVLSQIELKEIWGIGNALSNRLKKKNIYTALELSQKDDTWIQKELGVTGLRTVLELRGIPVFEPELEPAKKKSIVCSRSFGQKLKKRSDLEEAVATFTARAAEKLRDQESRASFLSVFIQTKLEIQSCHIELPNATSNTSELIARAKEGVGKLFRDGVEYRKAGVLLGQFTEDQQSDFLTSPPKENQKLMKLIDTINARYDKPIIRFAAEGIVYRGGKQSNRSPKFTTSWYELPIVK